MIRQGVEALLEIERAYGDARPVTDVEHAVGARRGLGRARRPRRLGGGFGRLPGFMLLDLGQQRRRNLVRPKGPGAAPTRPSLNGQLAAIVLREDSRFLGGQGRVAKVEELGARMHDRRIIAHGDRFAAKMFEQSVMGDAAKQGHPVRLLAIEHGHNSFAFRVHWVRRPQVSALIPC